MTVYIILFFLVKMLAQIVWPVNFQAVVGPYDLKVEVSASFSAPTLTTLPDIGFDIKGTLVNEGENIPFAAVGTTRLSPPRMGAHLTVQGKESDVACVASVYPDERVHILCASPQSPDMKFDVSVNAGPFKSFFPKQ